MMATVPHVTSGSGLTKFQADEFLFDRMYSAATCHGRVAFQKTFAKARLIFP